MDLSSAVTLVAELRPATKAAIARKLVERGGRVAVAGDDVAAAENLGSVRSAGPAHVFAICANLWDLDGAHCLADRVVDHFGRLDVLIVGAELVRAESARERPLAGVLAVLESMRACGEQPPQPRSTPGRARLRLIVLVSPVRCDECDDTGVVGTERAVVMNLANALQAEAGLHGIRVSVVFPRLEAAIAPLGEPADQEGRLHALRRGMAAEECAAAELVASQVLSAIESEAYEPQATSYLLHSTEMG